MEPLPASSEFSKQRLLPNLHQSAFCTSRTSKVRSVNFWELLASNGNQVEVPGNHVSFTIEEAESRGRKNTTNWWMSRNASWQLCLQWIIGGWRLNTAFPNGGVLCCAMSCTVDFDHALVANGDRSSFPSAGSWLWRIIFLLCMSLCSCFGFVGIRNKS